MRGGGRKSHLGVLHWQRGKKVRLGFLEVGNAKALLKDDKERLR